MRARPPRHLAGPPGRPGRLAGAPGIPGPGRAASGPGRPHPRRGGRTVLVGAVACVALLAVAVAGIVITGRLGAGRGPTGLVVAYPPARLADAQFAGPGGAPAPEVLPSLTGVAAAGRTVVAVGSQAALPFARPLVLTSPDGGRTWQSTVLRAPAGGGMPLMVAGGHGGWLAIGPDAAWTSPDGRSWRLGPGVAPLVGGDRVQALAPTRGGFAVVGENVRPVGDDLVRTPVLWTSANGLTWQRRGAGQLDLPAGQGRVAGLRWVAARGSVLMIAGEVARTVVRHHGKRKVSVLTQSPGVWRSKDNGASWRRADPPVSHGATARLAGLAATGSGIVAIRPGRGAKGTRDAVAYVWGRKPAWRFAGVLTAGRGAALDVTSVAGSDQGVVAAGSAGRYRVAFVSVHGWSWRQTAHLGRSSATAVTGVTVGPGGRVVAAGASHPRPFLLLAGAHRRHVGQAALAGAAAAGLSVNGLGAGPGGQVAVGQADGAPAVWSRAPGGQWSPAAVGTRPSWRGGGPGLTGVVHGGAGWLAVGGEGGPAGAAAPVGAAGTLDSATAQGSQQPILMTSTGRADLEPGRGRRAAGGTGPHSGRGRGGAARLRRGRYARRSRPADGCAVVVGGPHHLGAAGMVDRIRAQRRPVRAAGGDGWHQRFRRRGRRRRAPGRLAFPGRPGVAVAVAGTARRRAQRGAPARGHPGKPYHRPWHAGAAIRAGAVRRRLGQWRQDLAGDPAPGARPAGRVTALVAAGGGFLATGMLGDGGDQDVIIWWSHDGLAWHAVRPPGRSLRGPGAQQITGLSMSGNMLTGVGYTATGSGQHPVLWQARIR